MTKELDRMILRAEQYEADAAALRRYVAAAQAGQNGHARAALPRKLKHAAALRGENGHAPVSMLNLLRALDAGGGTRTKTQLRATCGSIRALGVAARHGYVKASGTTKAGSVRLLDAGRALLKG